MSQGKPEEVLQLRQGALISFDIVRVPEEHVYLVVFAEHGRIERRTLLKLPYDQALLAGRFLCGVRKAELSQQQPPPPPPEAVPEPIFVETTASMPYSPEHPPGEDPDPDHDPTKIGDP